MSYAASLLANYPSSYAPSGGLLSDNLVQRTNYDTIYPSSVPFLNDNHLLSDQLTYNPLNYNPTTTYQPSLYPPTKRNPVKATTQFSKSLVTNQRRTVPPNDSYASLNDITEYSDSLATASNTNTASTVARSITGNPKKTFPNHNQSNNQHIWSPVQAKTQKSQPINLKKPPVIKSDDDRTPIPSKQPNNPFESNQQSSTIDIQAWVNDTKKESPIDDELAEQAWSSKIEHLQQMKAQHEKDKAKSSRAIPVPTKKTETKPINNKMKPPNNYDSYFDSIFEGDYFRKPFSTDYTHNSSLHQPGPRKSKPTTNSFNNGTSKPSKYVPQQKSLQYEPPTIKRTQPTITTSSWRKNWPYQHYQYDNPYPYYLHNEFTYREFVQKDPEERYREALQKVRADRAEQQQRELEENEKTTKRLNYGDYVRRSTKEGSLQNPIKPSPWSDFMDLKKGNIYTISKEEKKQLYNQSKNYGERVRYRNFAVQHAAETSRSHRHSVPLLEDEYQESETDEDTVRPSVSKSVSQTPRRPDSAEGHKSRSKMATNSNRTSRSNPPAGQPQRRRSDNESDRESKATTKKKTVRYAQVDSSGRTTTNSDNESGNESSDNRSQRNVRMQKHASNDDLFTLREEKTLETIETSRYKKR